MSSRLLDQLRSRVIGIIRPTQWLGSYTYRVVDFSGGLADLQPVKKQISWIFKFSLPDLAGVPMWSGIPGGEGDPALGSFVLVRFADGDESTPYVEAFVGLSAPDGLPTRANLDASDSATIGQSATRVRIGGEEAYNPATKSKRFIREGDLVTVGSTGGAITFTGGTMSKAGT